MLLRPTSDALSCAALLQGVSFLGPEDEFVMSGSDCGHMFVWDARTGEVLSMLKVRAGRGWCRERRRRVAGRRARTPVAGCRRLPAAPMAQSGACFVLLLAASPGCLTWL